jgi:hypothetical protein
MLINEIKIPKNKNELIRRLQNLKSVKFEIYDGVKRSDISKHKLNIERFVGNDEVTLILIKSK